MTSKEKGQGLPVSLIQFCVLLGLFIVVLVFVPAVIDLVHLISPDKDDGRGELAIYADTPWSETHFLEFNRLQTTYYDFIGWRREQVAGETITIDSHGVRRTLSPVAPDSLETYFFGGSVMWGTGSNDENTIPSLYATKTGHPSTNYAESAWVAQQSTNMLIQLYTQGHHPERVYFLDGVNEVYQKCRMDNTPVSAAREQRFRGQIQAPKPLTLAYTVSPLVFMMQEVKRLISGSDTSKVFDCDKNQEKAAQIAENMVMNWKISRDLVESNGGHFTGLLQPTAFLGSPAINHLPEVQSNKKLKAQYDAVYPIMKSLLADSDLEWVDLTSLFDSQPETYIDFCHLIPAGNSRIVDKLHELMTQIE